MRVEIHRNETSHPLVYESVVNAYTKGSMYCVMIKKGEETKVHKYPLCSIFRIEEDYSKNE